MKSNREGDFENSVYQLVQLLKKIVKTYPDKKHLQKMKSLFDEQGININLYLMNFFPFSDDEWDDLEEMVGGHSGEEGGSDPLSSELNEDDRDFLRRHGIGF